MTKLECADKLHDLLMQSESGHDGITVEQMEADIAALRAFETATDFDMDNPDDEVLSLGIQSCCEELENMVADFKLGLAEEEYFANAKCAK